MTISTVSQFDQLLMLPGVTDLLVNSANEVFVSRGSRPLERVESPFASDHELDECVRQIMQAHGKHIDQASPFADCYTDNLRIHAILASACTAKTRVSVRVHSKRNFALDQLVALGTMPPEVATFLRAIIHKKQSFLISGATGSGKTTLLRAMLLEAVEDRIIAIEDIPELRIDSGHFISLATRQANVENRGAISLNQLLTESLRMRPDRLVVGEVRSSELLTLLEALNTGHSGAGSTIHANSLEAVPSRLELLAFRSGVSAIQLAKLVTSAISWVIHLENQRLVAIGKFSRQETLEVENVWP